MTPVGLCPHCRQGHLRPTATTGYVRCPWCITTFDHWGNGYDVQMRLLSPRDGT